MNAVVSPGARTGLVRVPASKSRAHRLLICAALSAEPCTVVCGTLSEDIMATVRCLRALGAGIDIGTGGRLQVTPLTAAPGEKLLPCGESGSTLRFLLPVVGALGQRAVFRREGRLSQRPLAPLDGELRAHGMRLEPSGIDLICSGKLQPGGYCLPGNVSSQYISGLLMALPLLDGPSELTVTGPVESSGYIDMTLDALSLAGAAPQVSGNGYLIPAGVRFAMPPETVTEGDWSGAAFFLCMGAMSPAGVTVTGLDAASRQGDRAILDVLKGFGASVTMEDSGVTVRQARLTGQTVDARMIPDLIPAVAALAASAEGDTHIVNAGRLRLKESDRLATTAAMIGSLGGRAEQTADGLIVHGVPSLCGGTADAAGDHRIAMAAAVAACACAGPVTVTGAECVSKSYPGFWEDLKRLEVC
ncbi:MAG: 3-phosphoshikimate 1-carboxyvinyltransferase [Oscillospiraceae bacterium]|nr:3-phosphoshikimate 1-carboxyvinyltransferase [Oscillospiraceae bacterium]